MFNALTINGESNTSVGMLNQREMYVRRVTLQGTGVLIENKLEFYHFYFFHKVEI